MADGNIRYRSEEIERFYRSHRTQWDQFYPSEQKVLSRLELDTTTRVLDIGCGCGGLGLALKDRFGVTSYTGVEINSLAVATAVVMNPDARFIDADILALAPDELGEGTFDLVVSLSCIDWNVEFDRMLESAWSYVRPGGHFLSSFRIVAGEGACDMQRSFQYINFEGVREGETAPYVVLGAHDLFARLRALGPVGIHAYGYWGSPSATAETPFDRICFAVVALEKPSTNGKVTYRQLELPADILEALEF